MTDIGVTTETRNGVSSTLNCLDVVHDILMTSPAGAFRDLPASVLHLDRFMKVARGEGKGMKKSVVSLGKIFRDQPGWGVTVIAGRNRAMTGPDPAVEVILHDVTVSAGSGIIAKIGRALGINEGVTTDSCRRPKSERDDNREQPRCSTGTSW